MAATPGALAKAGVLEPNFERSKATAWQASALCSSCALQEHSRMKGFHYVYILTSDANDEMHYSGVTRDLKTRLLEHNRGKCPHTAKHKPWKIETAVAFRSEAKARSFERYLKTGSGREFARRHF